jgi:hypothetical protein
MTAFSTHRYGGPPLPPPAQPLLSIIIALLLLPPPQRLFSTFDSVLRSSLAKILRLITSSALHMRHLLHVVRGQAGLQHRVLPACLLTTHRYAASSATSSGGGNDNVGRREVDVDAVARPMGYGPFSATAKARVLREKADATNSTSTADAQPSTVMHNVMLQTNLSLRLSLAGLTHPSQLRDSPYQSPEWRLAFVRLYRTILRLHNKTVAVSLRTARGQGPEAAVSAVTGVHHAEEQEGRGGAGATTTSPTTDVDREGSVAPSPTAAAAAEEEEEEYLLRYLLTPEQQEFGNRFVQGEFQRHMDADAVSAAIFYASWYDYVLQLASGVTSREMTETEKRLLSDEHKEKLNALRGAFVELRRSSEPQYMP